MALILMVLALAFLGQILSFLPEPIGSNAQAFSAGARTTLWLTLVSGSVGLALGTVGPQGSFASLTDFQTWVCTIGMLVGRLELLAVMVLFVPQFWRK